MENIYKPDLMEVVKVKQETGDVKRARIRFKDPEKAKQFSFNVGQFGIFSVFGVGESVFNICCSNSHQNEFFEFCFRKVGRVTERMWDVEPGDTIGFRGPFGNSYPIKEWEGKNLVFVAGGIAMPPIRCAIQYCLENRDKYGKITIVYGARTYGDLVCRTELDEWTKYPNVDVLKTVDIAPAEEIEWDGRVDFVPTVLKDSNVSGENAIALVVGPPIMIKLSLPILSENGFKDEDIFTSLENRMKCGLGKCGRCNCGSVYVCKEGPVFTQADIKNMPDDY